MLPLYQDPLVHLRFAEDRIIPRFHLEGGQVGRRVSVFKIAPDTGGRLGTGNGDRRELAMTSPKLISVILFRSSAV
jgi:hypothetical protein